MSALGQKQTCAVQNAKSALLSMATWIAFFGMSALGQKRTHAAQEKDRYSITSSARASSEGGTVRPSALAVLRFITSSYLVGVWTGSSAGFSPLRMRST